MFKRLRTYVCAFAIASYARDAFAIDPYTVVKIGVGIAGAAGTGGTAGAVLGVANGLMGGGSGGDAEDFASIGFAFTELLDDFEVDDSASDELHAKVQALDDVETKIREGETTAQDAKSAVAELKRADGMKQTLKAVHNMVDKTKSIAQMIAGHPKATQSALSVQQTRLDYMTLEEISKLRQMEIEKRIDQQTTESKYQLIAKSIRDEEKKAQKM